MSFRKASGITALLLVSTLTFIHGYPNGAPVGSCQNMTPQHDGATAKDSQFPYDFSIASGNSVNVGGRVRVKISAESSTSAEDNLGHFKGFLLQARKVGGTTAQGRWIPTDESKGLACGGKQNSALTHTDRNEKTELEAEWQPPTPGTYEIYATVVGDVETFWVGQKSGIITVSSS